MRPLRIVHIITRLIVGGAQENTLLSCEGQHDQGHEVTLITGPPIGPEGSLMERASRYGYAVRVIDDMRRSILPGRDFGTFHQLVKLLREIGPDVVHTHSSKAGILGRWAAHVAQRRGDAERELTRRRGDAETRGLEDTESGRLPGPNLRVPASPRPRVSASARLSPCPPAVIHTIHGLAFTASTSPLVNDVYKMLERHAAPLTSRIVCVADAMRDQSLAERIGTPGQYVTVYSGMKTAPFLTPPVWREEVRRQLGLREDDVALGTIARLFHLKGHEDLLEIAPDLCRRFSNLRFLWVGDGLLRPQFEKRIADMGLADRFILTGLVPPERIPELTNAMDILAHPSRREGLARALPQGSLAGKPVITYDIDGAREGVIDGQTGFVHPPFDKQKLADSIAALVADPSRRQTMGEAGRAFALNRFDSRVMVEALAKVYREAVRSAGFSPSGRALSFRG